MPIAEPLQPIVATSLRRRFSEEFGPEYEILFDLLAEALASIREVGCSREGLGWQDALDSGILDLVRQGRTVEAKERLQACLSSSSE